MANEKLGCIPKEEWDKISKQAINVPKTALTMPAGVSSDPSYYWIKDNMVHITINGIKATSTGEFTIPMPSEYCLDSDVQIIAPAQNFNGTSNNGFLRAINTGVKYKCLTANQACWGSMVYMIDSKV